MLRLAALLSGCAVAIACGPESPPIVGSQGLLELLEPASPIGLHYGEGSRLRVRYRYRGEPQGGAQLSVVPSGPLGGSTLSAVRLTTDGRGEASFTLQAGAAETAFQLLVSGPDAEDLAVDVAVSRRAFGNVTLLLDGRDLADGHRAALRALRVSLLTDQRCAELAPTPKPPVATRSLRVELTGGEAGAPLPFSVLLLRRYTAVGRAEDLGGRLLGWGCVELPESALVESPGAEAPLPLGDVYPRPVGSYTLEAQLDLDPPWSGWGALACSLGAGQALLDALLAALPVGELPLASRLQARRGPSGVDRCRPARRGPEDTADLKLDGILSATGQPGEKLRPVAQDVRSLQRHFALTSRLLARGEGPEGLMADHALIAVELDTATGSVSYDPLALGLPIVVAHDLVLPMTAARLDLPTHAFTIRLPMLWRQALLDVVLTPRGLASADRLLADAVAAARYGGKSGCAAVEALLCELAGAPCVGVLLPACASGQLALSADLSAALRDGAPGLDLSLGGSVQMEDPEGTLVAQTLDGGQAQVTVQIGGGPASAIGPLSGTRP